MPDETGTDTTRSDAPSADDSLFGDVPDEAAAAVAAEEHGKSETEQEPEGSETPDKSAEPPQGTDDADKAAEQPEGSGDAQEQDAPPEGLKVVLSIKGSRATIGVQQPSSDPHIESFDGLDEAGVTHEVAAVIGRAKARWEESPKHPAYERPAPPARRRSQETEQAANAEAETEQARQQTLRLF